MTINKKPMTLERAIQERAKAEKIVDKAKAIILSQAKIYSVMVLNMFQDEHFSPLELTKLITTKCGFQFKEEDIRSATEDLHYHGKITREPGFENRYKILGSY